MFTDKWKPEYVTLYARLLRVRTRRVLRAHICFSRETRGSYFSLSGRDDLFLDPDTGIGRDGNPRDEHVAPKEIGSLLQSWPSRVLLVYQNRFREKGDKYVRTKLRDLSQVEELRGCCAFAYYAGSVSMIFISRDTHRLDVIRQRLAQWLSPIAKGDLRRNLVGRIIEPTR
jgi:hypothetical protein